MLHQENRTSFIKAFMAGAVLGTIGGFMLHKNRRKIMGKVWIIKAKAEIYRRLGNLKEITRKNYEETVSAVLERYRTAGHAAKEEIDRFADKMMDKWQEVKSHIDRHLEEVSEETEEER